jgi:hypothetical protein
MRKGSFPYKWQRMLIDVDPEGQTISNFATEYKRIAWRKFFLSYTPNFFCGEPAS